MPDLVVERLRTVERDGTSRASAEVDGDELFFESPDCRLRAAPEAFASALLHLAAASGRRIVIDAPLDRVWLRNAARLLEVWAGWWDTPTSVGAVVAAPRAGVLARLPRPRNRAVGLCFSLGADSFHTLLRSGRRIGALVMAEGYDIASGDRPRMSAADASLRAVAAATGTRAVVVRTNLRAHPACAELDWQAAHGGALAALGHLLSATIGELLVTATFPAWRNYPWGSHHSTDRLWSGRRLVTTHVGGELRRHDRVVQIADEPLAHEHLRVCWENRRPTGNCGECEKCVRTMLALHAVGRLDDFRVFPREQPLARLLDGVDSVSLEIAGPYRDVLPLLDDEELRSAVERLMERSGVPAR
jgi:hypothetical protein